MAVWSEIRNSRIISTRRFDGEYFSPVFLELEEKLLNNPYFKTMRDIIDVGRSNYGILPKSKDYLEYDNDSSNLFLLRGEDIRKNALNDNEWVKIPERYFQSKVSVENDDLLILIKGKTIDSEDGISWINNLNKKAIFNGSVFKISLNGKYEVDKGFLYALFRTTYLTLQKRRLVANATVEYNALDQIKSYLLILPDFSRQKGIGDLIRKYLSLLKQSKFLYTRAVQILETELGLDKLKFDKLQSYEARLSEVVENNRADADYYQLAFRQIESHLKSIQTIPFSKIATFSKGIEVGSGKYTDSGKLFARVSNIKEVGIVTGSSDKYISKSLFKTLVAFKPKVGELLLTKDGTPGVCYCLDTPLDGIISGGIVRLLIIDPSIPAEFLALAINSKSCRMQIERECSGALIVHWKPGSIKKLKIPVLSKSKMDMLANLVVQSKQALRESQDLLETAKLRVEELIEGAVQK